MLFFWTLYSSKNPELWFWKICLNNLIIKLFNCLIIYNLIVIMNIISYFGFLFLFAYQLRFKKKMF